MMDEPREAEFVKVKPDRSRGRVKKLPYALGAPINLGAEGQKQFVTLKDTDESEKNFVRKQFDTQKEALLEAATCVQLRKAGIPTHSTARYFEENGQHYVLYTDQTKGGTCQVWSKNNNAEDLKNMNLDLKSKLELKVQITDLANMCADRGFLFDNESAFFIIRDQTGRLSVMIGDIGAVFPEDVSIKTNGVQGSINLQARLRTSNSVAAKTFNNRITRSSSA